MQQPAPLSCHFGIRHVMTRGGGGVGKCIRFCRGKLQNWRIDCALMQRRVCVCVSLEKERRFYCFAPHSIKAICDGKREAPRGSCERGDLNFEILSMMRWWRYVRMNIGRKSPARPQELDCSRATCAEISTRHM